MTEPGVNVVLLAFLVAVATSALLTPVVRAVAIRFGLLDHAVTARKIHGQPVPRLGGVAIVVAFFGALGVAWLAGSDLPVDHGRAAVFALAALVIAALGFVDDMRGMKAWQKFVVQFSAAGLLFAYGYRIESLATPFGAQFQLGIFSLPFTLLWLVGITNAFNLIDGLDGLAGGVATIAVAVNAVIAFWRSDVVVLTVAAALGGAVIGFLRHNRHPASIFMGDTGSMFLGFVLASLAIGAHHKSSTAVAILVPITALGLPILDTSLAVLRRAAGGRHLFQADREHMHHRLLAMGLTHRRAVWYLWALSALFGVMAVALVRADKAGTALIAVVLAGTVYLVLSRLAYVGGGTMIDGRVVERAEAVRGIMESLSDYEPRGVWVALRNVAKAVDADCVRLNLVEIGVDGETVTRLYTAGPWHDAEDMVLARFRIPVGGGEGSWVEFAWEQGGSRLDPITEEVIRLLCQEVARTRTRREAKPLEVAAAGGRGSGRIVPIRRG